MYSPKWMNAKNAAPKALGAFGYAPRRSIRISGANPFFIYTYIQSSKLYQPEPPFLYVSLNEPYRVFSYL
jgi:hypothetical protein